MRPPANAPLLVTRVNFWWYAITLVPIAGLAAASAYGYLPPLVMLLAVFCLFFWVFSFIGALWSTFRKPKPPQ